MIKLATRTCRLLAGLAVAFLASAPAYADTYAIGLFEGASATGTGSGAFSFTKGAAGTTLITTLTLGTNTNSALANTTTACKTPQRPNCLYDFNTNKQVSVVVSNVNFNDGKTPPNQITGAYVEGLTGQADTAKEQANNFVTCNASGSGQKLCFYRIKFAFAEGAANSNPGGWSRTFTIERWKTTDAGDALDTVVVSNGRYYVQNTVHQAPEPGTLALVAVAFGTFVWRRLRMSREHGRFAV